MENKHYKERKMVENHVFYYRLLSILSEISATITITIDIGEKWTFGHPWGGGGGLSRGPLDPDLSM